MHCSEPFSPGLEQCFYSASVPVPLQLTTLGKGWQGGRCEARGGPTVSIESSTDMRVCRRFRCSMLVNSMWIGFIGPV